MELAKNRLFIPFALTSLGTFGPDALKLIDILAIHATEFAGYSTPKAFKNRAMQMLIAKLHFGNINNACSERYLFDDVDMSY